MKYTNTTARLFIALNPEEAQDASRNYTELKDITELSNNISYTKADKTYYQNKGDQTSIITGRQISLNVTCDFDSDDEVHKYLRNLLFNQDFTKLNNQYIKIEIPIDSSTKNVVTGKCCFSFGSGIPNGAPTDIQQLSFEIHPMDSPFTITTE